MVFDQDQPQEVQASRFNALVTAIQSGLRSPLIWLGQYQLWLLGTVLLLTGVLIRVTGFAKTSGFSSLVYSSLPLGQLFEWLSRPPANLVLNALVLLPVIALARSLKIKHDPRTLLVSGVVVLLAVCSWWSINSPASWDAKSSGPGVAVSKLMVGRSELTSSGGFETNLHQLNKQVVGRKANRLGGLPSAEHTARGAVRFIPESLGLSAQFWLQLMGRFGPLILLVAWVIYRDLGKIFTAFAGFYFGLWLLKGIATALAAMLIMAPVMAAFALLITAGVIWLVQKLSPPKVLANQAATRFDTPPVGASA